jgi:D-glycero-D-manno-heptose 1,7-bisphosphate phosphatase
MSSHDLICRPGLYCPPQSRLAVPEAGNVTRRAVFLDRDGTLVEDVGYLIDPSQLKLQPGSIEGIRLLQDQFLIILVTNQSAIARGLLDEKGLLQIHQALAACLQGSGTFLDAVYACPHHPEWGDSTYRVDCYCRKPQPGMLLQARDDFHIRLGLSFMVGNKGYDILAGQRAGVAATVLIKSSENDVTLTPNIVPTFVADDLYNAARLILTHQAKSAQVV